MIALSGIHKSFNGNHAVNGVSLRIRQGEFYSLLGPNGAGKTTTINIISTLLAPDSGTIEINGFTAGKDNAAIRKIIGVVPQEISLYEDLPALDNLLFFGSLYDLPNSLLKSRAETLLADFGLIERKKDRIRTFSGGMKRRINIAVALMHDPKILIMDEPTVGIDPQSRNAIYESIRKIKERGITILYTTHYMEEAERFSDRIGIIDVGKIIAEGTFTELLSSTKTASALGVEVASVSPEQLVVLNNKWSLRHNDNTLVFSSADMRSDMPVILSSLFEQGIEIHNIDIQHAGLESVFLSLTGKNLRD
jgi:ABC-2 type transport system ATP-binding protein